MFSELIMKTTPLHYRKYMFMYGITTIINVLKYFEEKEDFEECYKIISAIKEQEREVEYLRMIELLEWVLK